MADVRDRRPPPARGVKVLEISNVDFSMRQFVLPLMRAIRARGHEVVGVSADGALLDDVRAEGFRVITLTFGRRLFTLAHPRAFLALVALLRAEKPDLVHAHMPISGFLARMAAWVAGVPRIAYTCHGFWFNAPASPFRRGLGYATEWLAARVTHVFMTVSVEEARDARRVGIARHAVAIGNGRDPAVFRPDPEARARLRAAFGVPPERVVILAASRLVRHKGYPELIAALRAMRAGAGPAGETPEVELWVAGARLPTDNGPDMARLLADAGLGARLRLLGYRSDVPALMAAADIFVLPSHLEGLPMAVIEAMLCALPVVSTDIRGPREQVIPEVTGLLVPRGTVAPLVAALTRLAQDPALRAAMGTAGRARACEVYDESTVIARTLDLLGL